MKRHTIQITLSALVVGILLMPAFVFAQQDTPTLTGAGSGAFPNGTTFSGVSVSGMTFGIGVYIYSDGSATGQFETTLLGTTILGQAQNIEVEGKATAGVINADGSRTFSGTVTLDM